jgi:hypothetical protein
MLYKQLLDDPVGGGVPYLHITYTFTCGLANIQVFVNRGVGVNRKVGCKLKGWTRKGEGDIKSDVERGDKLQERTVKSV